MEPPQETLIEVEAPLIDIGVRQDDAYFIKLPNFLSIDPKCVCLLAKYPLFIINVVTCYMYCNASFH